MKMKVKLKGMVSPKDISHMPATLSSITELKVMIMEPDAAISKLPTMSIFGLIISPIMAFKRYPTSCPE